MSYCHRYGYRVGILSESASWQLSRWPLTVKGLCSPSIVYRIAFFESRNLAARRKLGWVQVKSDPRRFTSSVQRV